MGWVRITVALIFSIVVLNSAYAMFPNQKSYSSVNTLYVATYYDFTDLNFFNSTNIFEQKMKILSLCFDSLLDYTPDFMIYNKLAEDYEIMSPPEGNDTATVVVTLRKNVTFHDGVELKARDVVFTYQVLYWNRLYREKIKCLYWENATWDRWDHCGKSHIGVEAVDDYTLKFHLTAMFPLFFYFTLEVPIIPEHVWKEHLIPANTNDSDDMTIDENFSEISATIGCGPWKMDDWQPFNYTTLIAYTDYWGKDMTVSWVGKDWPLYPKYVKRIFFKYYNTLDVFVLALRLGEVEYMLSPMTPGYYESLKDDPRIGFEINTDWGFTYLAFNMRREPLSNKTFRKAIAHCVDREYIVDRVLHGYGINGTVPIAITNPRYVNESAMPPEFNLTAAQQLLDQAGYIDSNGDGWRDLPNGSAFALKFLIPTKYYDPIMADTGTMIAENLKNIGINVEEVYVEPDALLEKIYRDMDFDMYIYHWSAEAFPENYLYSLLHTSCTPPAGYNSAGYSNSEMDELLDAMICEMDDAKRADMVKDIEGIAVEDLPYLTLYYRKNIEAYRQDSWQGWVPAFGTIFNRFFLSDIHRPIGPRIPEPSFLTADVGFDYVNLTWQYENYTDVTFRVYRSTDESNYSLIGSVKGKLYYNDTTVVLGVKYWYFVTACVWDMESDRSNIINVTPGSPSPPRNVKIWAGKHYVNISWDPPAREGASPLIMYKIYEVITNMLPYKCPVKYWIVEYRGKVPATQRYFNYTNVENGRKYYFFVTAVNGVGESPWSELVSAVPRWLQDKVENLRVELKEGYPYLSWEYPEPPDDYGFEGFVIYRSTDGKNFTRLAITKERHYHDLSAEEGKQYYYYVCILINSAEGPPSQTVKIFVPYEMYSSYIFSAWLLVFIILVAVIAIHKNVFENY